MTAPTHYNGKPIPSGTWLARAAEAADRDGVEPLLGSADDELCQARAAGMIALQQSEAERERADVAESALAAVTAERDQAIRNLCEDGPCPVEDLHRDAVIRAVAAERELEKARQMLADAPHANGCSVTQWWTKSCTCWKGTL